MRVLYFHQHFSTLKGSTGTRSYEMAKALVASGHQVTLVCGTNSAAETGLSGSYENGIRSGVVEGFRVIEFELPYANRDGLARRTWAFLRYACRGILIALRGDYDLVFATSTPLTAGIPGVVAKVLRGKPFVFEVRDLWPELPRAMGVITNPIVLLLMSALEWTSYRTADSCVGLSPGIVDGIVRRGVPSDKVVLIPNGCDLELFEPVGAAGYSGPGSSVIGFRLVFAGAHGIANGLDAVLDAADLLKKLGRQDLELIFVGDGKLKEQLVERAKREGLDNCTFLPPMPKADLADLMRSCDAGLMILANVPAFYFGTSPNKFFDYISAGLPVVTNYPGWLAGMINDRDCSQSELSRGARGWYRDARG